jgi:hypothetical protein
VHRAEEFVGAAGSAGPRVAGRKIVPENICGWNSVLLDQPANKRRRSGSLRPGKLIMFAPDMFNADRAFVRAHAMVRPIAVPYHLINIPIAIDDVVGGNLPAS